MLKGSKYRKAYYLDTLALAYDLLSKARKEGMMSLEADVEDPENSAIFVLRVPPCKLSTRSGGAG